MLASVGWTAPLPCRAPRPWRALGESELPAPRQVRHPGRQSIEEDSRHARRPGHRFRAPARRRLSRRAVHPRGAREPRARRGARVRFGVDHRAPLLRLLDVERSAAAADLPRRADQADQARHAGDHRAVARSGAAGRGDHQPRPRLERARDPRLRRRALAARVRGPADRPEQEPRALQRHPRPGHSGARERGDGRRDLRPSASRASSSARGRSRASRGASSAARCRAPRCTRRPGTASAT